RIDPHIELRRGRVEMRRTGVVGWTLAAPALVVIAVFFAVPVIAGLALSLTDFDLYALADLSTLRFVGLDNYLRLLHTDLFWQALGNTFYFVALGVPASIGLSLGAALLLNARVAKFQALFRTALFAPVVTTVVAVAVIWRYLLHTRYGLINQALAEFGIDPVNWLGDPHWSMPAIILFAAWKNFGYNMIILLAALQAVPHELYEAARVDGARPLRQFTDLTFPMLTPTLVMVAIMTIAGYFQLFAEPYVMTQGGPLRSTVSVLYFMYEEGFRWWNLGYASAVAFLLFLVIFTVSAGLLRFDRDPEASA
ncbi:MAG: sugar ABC transporter permease, partial [Caldimonas sp.]